jgi:hypothetical protein
MLFPRGATPQPVQAGPVLISATAPIGADGDEMVRRLSRHLVGDLMDQAAELLKYQIGNRRRMAKARSKPTSPPSI